MRPVSCVRRFIASRAPRRVVIVPSTCWSGATREERSFSRPLRKRSSFFRARFVSSDPSRERRLAETNLATRRAKDAEKEKARERERERKRKERERETQSPCSFIIEINFFPETWHSFIIPSGPAGQYSSSGVRTFPFSRLASLSSRRMAREALLRGRPARKGEPRPRTVGPSRAPAESITRGPSIRTMARPPFGPAQSRHPLRAERAPERVGRERVSIPEARRPFAY